jgi:hypothetical protein
VAAVESLLATITQVVRAGGGGLSSPGGEPEGSRASKCRRVSLTRTPLPSALTRDLYSDGVEEGEVVASGNE